MKKDSLNVLEIENVCCSLGRFALQDISFSLEKGYFMGVLGRNGAGKSSLINILLGKNRKKSGKIYVDGIDMDQNPLEVKQKLGFVVDDQPFFLKHTVLENGSRFGSFYRNYSEELFRFWLKEMQIKEKVWVKELSKGENVKLQLAFALAHSPSLLILDEPTGNLDPVFRKEFIHILQDAIARQEVSVLMTTHLTKDVERVADYIVLMEQGKVVHSGSMDCLRQEFEQSAYGTDLMEWMYDMTRPDKRTNT